MRALVLLGGGVADYGAVQAVARSCSLIVAADGGARHLDPLGLVPDRLVGDFDSIGDELLERLHSSGIPTERHPADKDMTDSEIAFRNVEAQGADEVLVVGALGSRPDHGLANQLLSARCAARGVRYWLFDGRTLMTPLCGGTVCSSLSGRQVEEFLGAESAKLAISLIPLSPEAKGVHTRGLRFPLDGATLATGSTLGVSNQLDGSLSDLFVGCTEGSLLFVATPAV